LHWLFLNFLNYRISNYAYLPIFTVRLHALLFVAIAAVVVVVLLISGRHVGSICIGIGDRQRGG